MNNKKRNNKGFSLVELIVVVAIMAVLVGVLAPAYLTYVEKSRIQKDKSAVEEVRHAVEVAIAEEAVYDKLDKVEANTTTNKIVVEDETAISGAPEELVKAVNASIGESVDFVSKEYQGKTYTVTIGYDSTNKTYTVKGAFN